MPFLFQSGDQLFTRQTLLYLLLYNKKVGDNMIYLEKFAIPDEKTEDHISHVQACEYWQKGYTENRYPCEVFADRGLHSLDFSTVTILYGGNGSGKSTLLNLVAEKLQLNRLAPFNKSAIFDYYLMHCDYETAYDYDGDKMKIPEKSRIITSDDVFDYMLNIRVNNENIDESVKKARDYKEKLAFKHTIKMKGMQDYERVREQLETRRLSGRKYVQKYVGEGVRPKSNGETALRFFNSRIEDDILCLLDEPENSMSPKFQIELVKNIEEMARYCGCQFVIATHSPFLLAIENAKIYNLDATPITLAKWWELENPRIYFDFFNKHKRLFDENNKL